jgi:hypothetical protein
MSYDVTFTADGTRGPDQVTNFQLWWVPARSTRSAANLYIRVAGIAHFDVDPVWDLDDPLQWYSAGLVIVTPQAVLAPGDALLESAVFAGFRQITRHEEGSTDDFGVAVDAVASVSPSPMGNITIGLDAGYKGDAWVPSVTFAADLLVYRPSFDNPDGHRRPLLDFLKFLTPQVVGRLVG